MECCRWNVGGVYEESNNFNMYREKGGMKQGIYKGWNTVYGMWEELW
jgi:hypothetical protein